MRKEAPISEWNVVLRRFCQKTKEESNHHLPRWYFGGIQVKLSEIEIGGVVDITGCRAIVVDASLDGSLESMRKWTEVLFSDGGRRIFEIERKDENPTVVYIGHGYYNVQICLFENVEESK